MKQRSLDNLLPSQKNDSYRYSFGFHHVGEKVPSELVDFVYSRFPLWHICVQECSDNGLWHLQCYGETKQAICKSDRQMFQGKGRYSKFLNDKVAKRYWFANSRKERIDNIRYVLKDVKKYGREEMVYSLNPQHSREELDKWIEEAHEINWKTDYPPEQKEPRNYQEKLIYWYRDLPVDERPVKLRSLIEKMIRCKVVPWQNLHDRALVSSAELILTHCTSGHVFEQVVTDRMKRLDYYLEKNYGY